MTAAPDTRVPPLKPGTVCLLDGQQVRAYARIWPGQRWDGTYTVYLTGARPSPASRSYATREQLEVIACR